MFDRDKCTLSEILAFGDLYNIAYLVDEQSTRPSSQHGINASSNQQQQHQDL